METERSNSVSFFELVPTSSKVSEVYSPIKGRTELIIGPRWSFGGNRLQIKAEDKVLADVESALKHVASLGTTNVASYKSLQSKQELLLILLENERMRLKVWLSPLEQERKHYIPTLGGKTHAEVSFERESVFSTGS
jgi:hypothetical protein